MEWSMASVYCFWPRVLGRMVRPRAVRISSVKTWAGRCSMFSSPIARSTASASKGVPVRATSMSSLSKVTAVFTAPASPAIVTSLPRRWKDTSRIPRSMARSTSSREPNNTTGATSSGRVTTRTELSLFKASVILPVILPNLSRPCPPTVPGS